MLPKPKAILFDWDGTIIDSLPLVNEAFNHTRLQFGLEPESLEQTHKNSVYGGETIFKRDFGMDRWEEARKVFLGYFLSRHLGRFGTAEERASAPDVSFMPGAYALLDWLAEQGITCGIVTNRGRISVGPELDFLKYNDLFKVAVCIGEAPKNKPDAAAALYTLDKMGLQPMTDIWLVGDTYGDVACANAAGLTSVLVYDGDYTDEAVPALHLNNCADLLNYLQKYTGLHQQSA